MDADQRTLTAAAPRERDWPALLRKEAKSFAIIFSYLAFVAVVLWLHQWVVLSAKGIDYQGLSVALLNALVLSKVILIAEDFSFADGLRRQPLVYRVLFKSIAFAALLVIVHVAEEMFFGELRGDGPGAVLAGIGNGRLNGAFAMAIILCIALIPFFFFRELGRQMGPEALRALCFSPLPPVR